MIEQLVTKHKTMQQRHADASASYRQSTMTQEFEGVPVGSTRDELPPNWSRLWDNSNKRPYYYNSLDQDMQYEISKVYERAALTAKKQEEENSDEFTIDGSFCPDGVLSSNKTTISPSPVTDRLYDRARKPSSTESPVKNGGFVDMTGDSSDDDSRDDRMSSSGLKSPPVLKTPSPSRKRAKRSPLGSPKTANPWATRIIQKIKQEKPSWVDDVDRILGSVEDYEREVHTGELPNTQDFGGASALVALQSEPKDFQKGSVTDTE